MNKTLRSSLNMINKDPKMILTKSTLVGGGLLASRIKNDLDKTKQNQGYVSDFYLNKNSKRENSLGYGSLNLFMCNFKWGIIIIILVIELNKESVIYIAKKLKLEGFCLSFF